MKINNKPMSALPSVADTPADTGRSCVRLFGLYTILPKVLRVVVEVLFLYHHITGFYHLEPFLRFGKHVRETASFQQKGHPYGVALDNRGAKGTPVVCWYSAVSSAFRNCGYLVGYLTWFFSRFFSTLPHVHEKDEILSIYQENARRPQERRALSVANNR